jgi:hypothetical protein
LQIHTCACAHNVMWTTSLEWSVLWIFSSLHGVCTACGLFPIALDSAIHQNTSYLNLRFWILLPSLTILSTFMGVPSRCLIGKLVKFMYKMVNLFLSNLCPDWNIRLLGVQ